MESRDLSQVTLALYHLVAEARHHEENQVFDSLE